MRAGPMISLASPRAPTAPLGAALYESHYLTAADPAGGRALWLRFTALKRPGEPAHPTTWLTCLRRVGRGAPGAAGDRARAAGRSRSAVGAIEPGGDRAVGHPGRAERRGCRAPDARRPRARLARRAGTCAGSRAPARWPTCPRGGSMTVAVPRSNGAALVPAASATGTLVLDGDEVTIDGWEAMVGHNWGSEHAHQWCWMHAGGLGEDGRGWLDLALVRIRIGPAGHAVDRLGRDRRRRPALRARAASPCDVRARRGADDRPRLAVGGRGGEQWS